MENELDRRLLHLQLEEYRSITDRTQNDCLFVAAIDRIREYAYSEKFRNKALIASGGGHVDSVLKDSNGLDVTWRITDVQALRNYIALAGMQYALRANSKRTQLLNHIKHRFSNGMCEADAALHDVEPLEQNPSEIEIVTKWAQIISNGGMLRTYCSLTALSLLHIHSHHEQVKPY
jgi:hypothetical protein